MGTWLTADELNERHGEARIARLADRGDSSVPADVIATAIGDAEAEANGILRGRYAPSDLPTSAGDTSQILKQAVARLAVYNLHGHYDVTPDDVKALRAAARSQLEDIKNGGAALLLAGAPAVDVATLTVATARRSSTNSLRPMTLDEMEDMGGLTWRS